MVLKLNYLILSLNLIVLLGLVKVDAESEFLFGKSFRKISHDLDKANEVSNDLYFDQILDHFNLLLKQKWKQRYWVNEQYFDKKSGPVFIFIGGEGEASNYFVLNGLMVEMAEKLNALVVSLEHRFYGKSKPTSDLSVKNLVYLNSKQALADLANFRQFIHNSYDLSDSNKWVFFGGSYPGSLSAWFRLKYPHLAHASVSSSAPINAILDFSDYLVVVNRSLYTYSPECSKNINNGMQQLINLMRTKQGRKTAEKLFKTCQPLKNQMDIANFYSNIIGFFQSAVQSNPNQIQSNDPDPNGASIADLCTLMNNNDTGDALQRLADVNDLFSNSKCRNASYASMIKTLKETSWNKQDLDGYRQWTYQTCAEFGFFLTTNSKSQPFGDVQSLNYLTNICKDVFGNQFDLPFIKETIRNTNLNFGAYNFKGSRVVFTNGDVDPWSALGFTKQAPNNQTDMIYIKGTSHCADLGASNENDLPNLKKAREQIFQIVSKYLNEN